MVKAFIIAAMAPPAEPLNMLCDPLSLPNSDDKSPNMLLSLVPKDEETVLVALDWLVSLVP